jgi:hypothetical protein
MEELDRNKRIFFIRHGISISLLLLIVVIFIILNMIKINQYTEIEIVKVGYNSYLGILQSYGHELKLHETILFEIDDESIYFTIDSINTSSNILHLTHIDGRVSNLPLFFNAKLDKGADKLWNILFTQTLKE